MREKELKHVIALLLEDAKRLQQIEPNAGTEARIWLAKDALESGDEATKSQCDCDRKGKNQPGCINVMTHIITPLPCKGDGVDRVYHDTMVKALRIELDGLRRKIVMNEIITH